MIAPSAAPASGATQNNQTWLIAPFCAKIAAASERAGLTDVLLTGIDTRWINVSPRPMAIGAKPAGARLDVEPKMMMRKNAVITTSMMKTDIME